MMPRPSTSGTTQANVTSSRSLRSRRAQLASTHPLRKCVTGLMCWSLGPSDFDQHVAVFDLQRIGRNLRVGVVGGGAGLRIVGPAMPGADHFALFDRALAQRSTLVQANIVHGGVSAVDVGDADLFVAAGEFFGLVDGGEFGLGREFSERVHL